MGKKSVLVLEDDDSIRYTLKYALEFDGYEAQLATNGKEGLELLSKVKAPCLILLDLMMPVMDGWTFASKLKETKDLSSIPIVIVTAFAEKSDLIDKAVSVLKKPVDLDILLTTVKSVCGESSR